MAAARQARSAAGVKRIETKLKSAIDQENFYEAHQLYRTLYFRFSSQAKFGEAEDLLYEGSLELFKHKQVSSGTDLAILFIEVLVKSESTNERSSESFEKSFQRVAKIFDKFPRDSPYYDNFKSQAIQWSSSETYRNGHPRLHQLIAHNFWTSKRYSESRQNFLQSCDGSGCGRMLVEFHTCKGYPTEVDLFIVNTVLQYLVLRKHVVAAWALKAYTENHPSIKRGPPYKHPLLNFIWLLLLSIETKQTITAFSTLVELYKPSLQRDPGYLEYIDQIGQHFFGLPQPQRPRGMFSGLFDSLMNAINEDSDDETEQPTPNTSAASISMDTQDLD